MQSRPPRREPRVLALRRSRGRIAFAVLDPWDVRSAGSLIVRPRAEQLALRRLLRREKPTGLVVRGAALRRRAGVAARALKIPVVPCPTSLPNAEVARELYPELRLYAPSASLEATARLAIAAVLGPSPHRTYATRRRHPMPRATGSPPRR